jgi:uncharacterized protein (DUF488 family)
MAYPFFTIGHSTRTIPQFVDLLRASQVELVADVRHIPRSRTNPQFNLEQLPDALATVQIGYLHLPALGGLRNRSSKDKASPSMFWENLSFRNYADYALTQFQEGLAELQDLGHQQATAIMCAEAVWWRCHRRIIADYLICGGENVLHILGTNRVDQARLAPGASLQLDGTIIYPPGNYKATVLA